MLLMQAFDCEVLRALTKLGIAIAARRPMMATTIMISTSVKPPLRDVLIFICFSNFLRFCLRREHKQQAGYLSLRLVSTHCLLQPHIPNSSRGANVLQVP